MPYWLVIILVAFPSGEELHTIGHPVKYASQQECEAAISKIYGIFADKYHTMQVTGECHPEINGIIQ